MMSFISKIWRRDNALTDADIDLVFNIAMPYLLQLEAMSKIDKHQEAVAIAKTRLKRSIKCRC